MGANAMGANAAFRVLSIDVGMKNLAYCLFEYDPLKLIAGEIKTPEHMMQLVNIMAWDTVNLCDPDEPAAAAAAASKAPMCSHDGCKFAAKFAHAHAHDSDEVAVSHYCTKHANASGYKMPLPSGLGSTKTLKKMGLEELRAFSGEYLSVSIPEKSEKSKLKLLQHVTAALTAEYLVAVSAKPKVVSAASLDLITIGRNMHRRFDALPHLASGIDVVIIENQLSTLATRMKTLQGMITQYFIMRGVPDIRFISATNKLKLFAKEQGQGAEDCYADRKKRSIEITRSLITAPLMSMKFERHKKKDDLADCFLQGMWWLSENYVKAQRSASK
uniref:Mitochondrial resolvase Ydc2 catalytic domain-containing protein n=1 Tax=viral metagenome TaxID=1070528 RepID=A0A6C0I6B7_9ZZZZ